MQNPINLIVDGHGHDVDIAPQIIEGCLNGDLLNFAINS